MTDWTTDEQLKQIVAELYQIRSYLGIEKMEIPTLKGEALARHIVKQNGQTDPSIQSFIFSRENIVELAEMALRYYDLCK